MLRRHGYVPRLLSLSRALKHRTELLSAEFVVVTGGDGAVKPVAQALAGTGQPLAIIPLGTANNIARSLGISGTPAQIIAGWRSGRRQGVDLGVAAGP
jgi:diacylglycerol kinase (ATP)